MSVNKEKLYNKIQPCFLFKKCNACMTSVRSTQMDHTLVVAVLFFPPLFFLVGGAAPSRLYHNMTSGPKSMAPPAVKLHNKCWSGLGINKEFN